MSRPWHGYRIDASYAIARVKKYAVVLGLLAILVLAAWLRFSSLQFQYTHPDEIIAASVAQRIVASGSLDTNWRLASLPAAFNYDQYNFSGFNLSAALVLKASEALGISSHAQSDSIKILRMYSSVLGVLVVLLTFLLGRQLFDAKVGLFAALLCAVAVLLYQDSLYARPETFVSLLVLLTIYISGIETRFLNKCFFACLIWGILIATKISMIVLVPIALLPLDRPSKRDDARGYLPQMRGYFFLVSSYVKDHAALALLGLFAGFFLAAPYAVLNPKEFAVGIAFLRNQYSSVSWPHGIFDGSRTEMLLHAGEYFRSTLGLTVMVLFCVGAVQAFRLYRFRVFGICIFVMGFFIWFSAMPVFFERNFSHLLPVIFICAGFGVQQAVHYWRARPMVWMPLACALVIFSVAPGVAKSALIRFDAINEKQAHEIARTKLALQKEYGLSIVNLGWVGRDSEVIEQMSRPCVPELFQFNWPNDKYSANALQNLQMKEGFQVVASVPTLFPDVPASTLHTYLSPSTIFLLTHCPYGKKR